MRTWIMIAVLLVPVGCAHDQWVEPPGDSIYDDGDTYAPATVDPAITTITIYDGTYELCSPAVPCGVDAHGDARYYQMNEQGYVILADGQPAPPSQCERTMQAAMEAMERYVPYPSDVCNGCYYREIGTDEVLKEVVGQWIKAKACWK